MRKYLRLTSDMEEKYPGLTAQIITFKQVSIEKKSNALEEYKKETITQVHSKWRKDELRDHPIFRAYRDFFWKLGVDPTKNRPAAEALIRRILNGNSIPTINTWVDAYNIVSVKTAIPIASFDADLLSGDLVLREAKKGEKFRGIAMKKPITLNGGEAVVQDTEKLVAIYPYRDADYSKVTLNTMNVQMLLCGAPNISKKKLAESAQVAKNTLTKYCGGDVN